MNEKDSHSLFFLESKAIMGKADINTEVSIVCQSKKSYMTLPLSEEANWFIRCLLRGNAKSKGENHRKHAAARRTAFSSLS